MCSVRGMGVALMASTSTLCCISFSRSLWRDAEALLFVDDQQAEIVEFHILGKQAVRADDDIDLASFDMPARISFLLCGRAEAAEHLDAHGKRGEAAA